MKPLSGRQPWVSVGAAVAGPLPVGPAVERIGQAADLGLLGRVAVEIGGDGEHAREQERRVDRGQLALPDAAAGFDVEEMVEEALVAGGIRLGPWGQFEQIAQPLAGDLRRELAEITPRSTTTGIVARAMPHGGDADRGGRVGLVADQTVVRVGLVQVVQERGQLEPPSSSSVGSRFRSSSSLGGRQPWPLISVGRQPSYADLVVLLPSSLSGIAPSGNRRPSTRPLGRRDRCRPSCPPGHGTSRTDGGK